MGDDEGVDFSHYRYGSNFGKTLISDNSGNKVMTNAQPYIRNYVERNNEVGPLDILDEFLDGTGPEKSLFYGTEGLAGDVLNTYQVYIASDDFFNKGGNNIVSSEGSFGVLGFLRSTSLTQHMLGKASVSIYPLGDKAVVLVMDSKSLSSWTLNPFDGDEINKDRKPGKTIPKSTTRQSYLIILPKDELRKAHDDYEEANDTDY